MAPKIENCQLTRCGKPIIRRLFYRSGDKKFCSYRCFTEALSKENTVIVPSENKAGIPAPQGDQVKKKMKKKVKTGTTPVVAAPAAAPVSTGKKKKLKKKGSSTAAPAAAPATKKKAAASSGPSSSKLFRDGSMVGKLYERMKDGKKWTMENLFKGIETDDAHRLLTDLRNKGKKTEEFTIERVEPGVLRLVETA